MAASTAVSTATSASDALDVVIVRVFATLRALAVVLLLCYVSVWWSWYVTHPAGMAAAGVAAAWGVMFVAVSLRVGIGHTLAAANVAVAVGLAAAAPHILHDETYRRSQLEAGCHLRGGSGR